MNKKFRLILLIVCVTISGTTASADDKYFDSSGVKIHYIVEGTGSPVLLVHGYTANLRRQWVDLGIFEGLVSAGHRVIAFDLRGHGKSDWPLTAEMYGLEMVEDGRRLLDHLGIERAHIVGYSMGGKIVAKFGELHPGRAQSLTLGGVGIPFWAPDSPSEEQIAQSFRDLGLEGEMSPKAIAAMSAAYPDFLTDESALRKIEAPTLVIVGDADMRTEGAKSLAKIIPGARFVMVPGNHGEAPGAPKFLSGLVQFLGDHDTS